MIRVIISLYILLNNKYVLILIHNILLNILVKSSYTIYSFHLSTPFSIKGIITKDAILFNH